MSSVIVYLPMYPIEVSHPSVEQAAPGERKLGSEQFNEVADDRNLPPFQVFDTPSWVDFSSKASC
ncbi:hypothetical protein SOVF_083580 [Spinacia oleracea]|nr:hypothetical protein SOVF_083580 [Spinacia oleracea]